MTDTKRRWDFSTPDAIFEIEGLDIYAQTIYILLCAHADREGKSFPAYDTLAKRGRMSRRKAIDSVAALVNRGLLLKKEQKRSNDEDTYEVLNASVISSNEEGGVHSMHRRGIRCT